MTYYDAIIVGSGPNGLAAAITLTQAGQKVLVIEAKDTIGGGTRTAEITLPGFRHDICSAIHPLGIASPFFQNLPLADFGLEWITPLWRWPTPWMMAALQFWPNLWEKAQPAWGWLAAPINAY